MIVMREELRDRRHRAAGRARASLRGGDVRLGRHGRRRSRRPTPTRVRVVVEALCARGVDVAVVSGTHLENVDGQLGARPSGPGACSWRSIAARSCSRSARDGPRLLARREATTEEDAALTRAAEQTVARLAALGLEARIVSQRLNRRKIDLIPLPEWADPPKAEIDRLLAAVEERLRGAGIADLAGGRRARDRRSRATRASPIRG